MKKLYKKLRVPVLMVGGMFIVMQIAAYITGVPVFEEFRDRARRVVERTIPVTPVGERARKALDARLKTANLELGAETFVRIFKQEAEMEIWMKSGSIFQKLHTYPICKFSGFLGPKLKEGDRQAPEGFYSVTAKQLNPGSRHYRAFNLGFPNEFDRAHGRTGSALMVHGGCTSIGCYAMTDLGVGEIYRVVERALSAGQKKVPVHVFPFRMTQDNLNDYPNHRWKAFWQDLKKGHDLFETNLVPPKVSVCGKRYAFGAKRGSCKAIAGWS